MPTAPASALVGLRRATLLALGAVVTVLLPSLALAEHPAALGLAVVAVALAALCLGHATRSVTVRAVVRAPARGRVTPAPNARVTDPSHHPLRPRAPGTA